MDLWTHNDASNHTPMGAKETGSEPALRNTRRLTDRAILSLFRTWLLQDYTFAYARSLGTTRIFRRCYWIDALGGFSASSLQCSPDRHTPEQTQKPGKKRRTSLPAVVLPPALQPIANLSQSLSQLDHPITLHGLLLSQGSSQRKATRANKQRTQQHASPSEPLIPREGGIIPTSWLDVATPLLQEIEQSPAIFLLNPLGPIIFSNDDLLQLYQRTAPTELLLLIAHKHIESCLQSASKTTARATELTALLRSDRWKALPQEGEEAITGFLHLLSTSMQRHFQWAPQLIQLPMQQGMASTSIAPYTLVYATRRFDSLLCMNDACCLYQRRTEHQSYQGTLSEEWFMQHWQERHESELQKLSEQIHQQGRTLRARHWPDLRQHIIHQNFGHYTRQEYDDCIRQLIERGEVTCRWRRPAESTEARIPSNDDMLQW